MCLVSWPAHMINAVEVSSVDSRELNEILIILLDRL